MFSHQRDMLYPLLGRIIRVLAVIALALSPVWGFPTVHAASSSAPSRFPYWPGFFSSGCNAVTQSFGGVVIACGTGGYVETQITSAYGGCSEIDIDVNGFGSGPFITTATAPVGGIQNTITINDNGHYYMQLNWVPSTIIGPIAIQLTAPDTGNISIQNITVSPCPVPTSTPTINPSSTSTNTPVPVTGTPTPIPTFTPLPSGHITFTRTPTPPAPTGTTTNTPIPTATPNPFFDCGQPSYPLLNCSWINGTGSGTPPTHWNYSGSIFPINNCIAAGGVLTYPTLEAESASGTSTVCGQSVTVGATGNVFVQLQASIRSGSDNNLYVCATACFDMNGNYVSCPAGGSSYCIMNLGAVTASTSSTFSLQLFRGSSSPDDSFYIVINNVWVGSSSTPTPVPSATTTVTSTPAPGTSTPTYTPTLTPVPIPGAMSTAIPTDTECPGGCVVAQLTAIPGVATRFTVDTSPFSPFTSLSVSRSSCAPFGFVQIPYPVIHGTPALGSTNPLSITWTIPATSTWDDTHPFSNTAIQPCAMVNEIPSSIWDMTYWLSVFFLAVVFIMWLIGYVGRLSGDETING